MILIWSSVRDPVSLPDRFIKKTADTSAVFRLLLLRFDVITLLPEIEAKEQNIYSHRVEKSECKKWGRDLFSVLFTHCFSSLN